MLSAKQGVSAAAIGLAVMGNDVNDKAQREATQFFWDAISRQRYKHLFWDIAKGSQANHLGVEYEEYDSIIACRSAIIKLKYPLADLANHGDADEGVQAFETDAKVCRTVAYQSDRWHARKRR